MSRGVVSGLAPLLLSESFRTAQLPDPPCRARLSTGQRWCSGYRAESESTQPT
jgi:hypothetical protein